MNTLEALQATWRSAVTQTRILDALDDLRKARAALAQIDPSSVDLALARVAVASAIEKLRGAL